MFKMFQDQVKIKKIFIYEKYNEQREELKDKSFINLHK